MVGQRLGEDGIGDVVQPDQADAACVDVGVDLGNIDLLGKGVKIVQQHMIFMNVGGTKAILHHFLPLKPMVIVPCSKNGGVGSLQSPEGP